MFKLSSKQLIAIAGALLLLIAYFLLSATCVKYTYEGYADPIPYSGKTVWHGSFGNVVLLILFIVAFLASIAKLIFKSPLLQNVFNFVVIGAAVVGIVFLFCGATRLMIPGTKAEWDILNGARPEVFAGGSYKLAGGAIADAILLLLTGAGAAVDQFVWKEPKTVTFGKAKAEEDV